MKNNKADIGMGTLILFIAMILVAAVAASVLIATTSKLQNKALDTGKLTSAEVGTGLQAVEVYAEDGSNQTVRYWYETVKLSAGSDPLRFSDLLVSMSLSDQAQDYSYSTSNFTVNVSSMDGQSVAVELPPPDCTNATLNISSMNASSLCYMTDQNRTRAYSNYNVTCRNHYGVQYQITGTSYKSGYLNKGDVVKLCWGGPRVINESEDVKISLIPKVGSVMIVDTTTPDLMVGKRISIFP